LRNGKELQFLALKSVVVPERNPVHKLSLPEIVGKKVIRRTRQTVYNGERFDVACRDAAPRGIPDGWGIRRK
jgi:hypothetical protein